jgi:hypothetical protein
MIRHKKITHEVKPLFPALKSALEKEEALIFGYIFGSYAKDRISLLSDVDIAVYMDDKIKDRFDKRLDLIDMITRILKTDEVDLIVLNDAPLSMVFQVLKTKKLLFSKDDAKRIEFEVRAIKNYLDTEILRKRAWEAMKRRIEEERYGY